MKNLEKIVNWFCSKISYNELCSAVTILLEYVNNPTLVRLKESKEEFPNYRKFSVDERPPVLITEPNEPVVNYREQLRAYKLRTGKEMKPVSRHKGKPIPPSNCYCHHCEAPVKYLSYNNGKKQTQVRCKVCKGTSMINRKRPASEVVYRCPYCDYKLFRWKQKRDVIIYKCPNHNCKCYLKNKLKLTDREKAIYDSGKSSHFSLHYIYREFHFAPAELEPSRPLNSKVDLHKVHHTPHTVGLVLSYAINYGMSARMTADVMQNIHSIEISHQTVLNYINAAACYASRFIEKFKPEMKPGEEFAADETYIKVRGKHHYTWLVINTVTKAIMGFHLSDQRDTKHALITYIDAFGERPEPLKEGEAPKLFVADGNPSYDAAIHEYLRTIEDADKKPIVRKTVIGLKNLDDESKAFRQPKQLIERLNRTYKFHTRPRAGFKTLQGAIDLTTLFVAFYNYMRPTTRKAKHTPVQHDLFEELSTAPERWCKLLSLAA